MHEFLIGCIHSLQWLPHVEVRYRDKNITIIGIKKIQLLFINSEVVSEKKLYTHLKRPAYDKRDISVSHCFYAFIFLVDKGFCEVETSHFLCAVLYNMSGDIFLVYRQNLPLFIAIFLMYWLLTINSFWYFKGSWLNP